MEMKKAIWVILILSWCCKLTGQASAPGESIQLLTDRTLYVVNEYVQFSALLTYLKTTEDSSRVIYAEIISSEGKQVAGNKFEIIDGVAIGCLAIPGGIQTGYYFLRAYTRYMRNWPVTSFAYAPIQVINPELKEIQPLISAAKADISFTAGSMEETSYLKIKLDEDKIPVGTEVRAGVDLIQTNEEITQLSVAVIPSSTSKMFVQSAKEKGEGGQYVFEKETRGVSLSGVIQYDTIDQVIPGIRVNLSIIGAGRDFMATTTDEKGRFYFSLPRYTGDRDLFLCTESMPGIKTKLLVDNDYATNQVKLSMDQPLLTDDERHIALQLARNVQVDRYFHPPADTCRTPFEESALSFYGKPSDVIVFDEFISLPTLEEYINELTTAVKVRKQDGRKYFKVLGNLPDMVSRDPLVLVDWVAVDNPEVVLEASPNAIERVEVINVPYVKGDITYGGLIHIISKRGDFAGIDLPSSGIFLNYQFQADVCPCKIHQVIEASTPDPRNTVYWNAFMDPHLAGEKQIVFTAPETPGQYLVVVKGFNKEGKLFSAIEMFEVTATR